MADNKDFDVLFDLVSPAKTEDGNLADILIEFKTLGDESQEIAKLRELASEMAEPNRVFYTLS